jgi:hypothetical protein
VKLVRLRRPKIACSLSYVDYRPTRNTAILSDMGHTKGWPCMGGIGQGKENKNLNVIDALTVQECIEILNWLGLPCEGD